MKVGDVLAALPEVASLTVHRGQVLFYPHHIPPGIFIVIGGVLHRFTDGTAPEVGCGERLDAAAGPFAVPAPGEMAEPARAGIAAETDVEILFVPRSVVLDGDGVARTLAAAGVAVVPLGDGAPGREESATPRRHR